MESEVNGVKDDTEEPQIIDEFSNQNRSTDQQILGLQEMNTDEAVEQEEAEQQETSQQPMETFQSIVEEDSGNVYADAS